MPVIDTNKYPAEQGYRTFYYTRDPDKIIGVTIHYTASPTRSGQGAVYNVAAYQTSDAAKEQLRLTPRQPFPAIAYTFVVDGDGTAFQCHDLKTRVWHSGGFARNEKYIGICYIGDREPNENQLRGIARAIAWSEQETGYSSLIVEAHYESGVETACPGPTWLQWRRNLLQEIAAARGR